MRVSVLVFAILLSLGALRSPTPPWSYGANDPGREKGLVFHVDDIDNVPDLHGNPQDAKLVLFIGGNQFLLPRLIADFEKQHPELAGHIFHETLPLGALRKQMAQNDTVTLGNLTLPVVPDVYESGAGAPAASLQKIAAPAAFQLYARSGVGDGKPLRHRPGHRYLWQLREERSAPRRPADRKIIDRQHKQLPRGSEVALRGQVKTVASSFKGLLFSIGLIAHHR
jgi:hypothetical protein